VKSPDPQPVSEAVATASDGKQYPGTLMQYFHLAAGSMRGDAAEYVKSDCLRLRIPGYPDGEQDRHNPTQYDVPGIGQVTVHTKGR
jgi:hypothetical protein